MPSAPGSWVARGALAAAVGLAYCNTLHNPFVFDDHFAIVDNQHIRSLLPLVRSLAGPAGTGANGRPLVALSLAVNHAVGGLDVFGYHIFNLAVHMLAAWVFFGLARRTFARAPLAARCSAAATRLGFAVALLWALHPLHTAAIDHVIYRNELLMGLFYLMTLTCVARGAESGRRGWSVAAVAACLLGVMSKEVIVTAPLLALLYDRTFLSGSFRAALRRRPALYLGLAATWIPLALLVATARRGASAGIHVAGVTPLDYARTQIAVVVHDLRLVFWPDALRIDSYWRIATRLQDVWPQAVLLGALVVGTLWALWRRPVLGFLGAWFFVVLLPTSSFVPLAGAIAAEHRLYLSLVAPVALVVVGGYEFLRWTAAARAWLPSRRDAISVVCVAGLAVALGARTFRRNADFQSEATLWAAELAADPDNPRAHDDLGAILIESGDLAAGIREYERALASDPNDAAAHLNLVSALMRQGRPDAARAHLNAALRLDPQNPTAQLELGTMELEAGRPAAAVDPLREAVRLQPYSAAAHQQLALALRAQGDDAGAAWEFRAALQLAPESKPALVGLAWVLATSSEARVRDGRGAVLCAERAARLGGDADPDVLDALAAAYAEAGQFGAAIRTVTKARELAIGAGRAAAAEAMNARLALYRSHQPFHAPPRQAAPSPRP